VCLCLLQCECSYYEADAAVLALLEGGKSVEKPACLCEFQVDEYGVRAAANQDDHLRQVVCERLLWGMQRAVACAKPWAVTHGAVYCWNAFLPAVRAGR
jgi:hypothetical protein